MYGIHILNKLNEGSNFKRLGLDPIKGSSPLQFKSGYWDPISMGFKNVDEVREKLVGGMVFLHNDKNTDSFVGGLVLEIDEVMLDEEEVDRGDGRVVKREDRFQIIFQSMLEGKGQSWRGRDHSMSYTSGLIEIE